MKRVEILSLMEVKKAFMVTLALSLVSLKSRKSENRKDNNEIGAAFSEKKVQELRSIFADSKEEMILQHFKYFLEKNNNKQTSMLTDNALLEITNTLIARTKKDGCMEVISGFVSNQVERKFGRTYESCSFLFLDSETGVNKNENIVQHNEDVNTPEIFDGLFFILSNASRLKDAEWFATSLVTAAFEGITKSEYDATDASEMTPEMASNIIYQLVDSYLTGFMNGGLPTSHSELCLLRQAENFVPVHSRQPLR